MEVSFSVIYGEGNELRVSLSSFTKASLGEELIEVLGDVELVDVTLIRQSGELRADWKTLNKISSFLGKILHDNRDAIFYYYCDELNSIPNMRNSHGLNPSEYRNRLFSVLFEMGKRLFPEDTLVDDLITIKTEQGTAYIHLIYHSRLAGKADAIKDELKKLAVK